MVEVEVQVEPLLNEARLCLLPVRWPTLYGLWKKHVSTIWTTEEIDFTSDLGDWLTATDAEKDVLRRILSFFAIADSIVMANVSANFADEVKAPEARMFYAIQNFMEAVHVETYNRTIDTYFERDEALALLQNVPRYPSVVTKKNFCETWMHRDRSFAERLVAFACVEGILFSTSFALIFWFKKHNKFTGLTVSNEFISRDEALHTEFAVTLHNLLQTPCPSNVIHAIVADAVAAEQAFVVEALAQPLGDDLTANDMRRYVQFVADDLLSMYGLTPETPTPLPENLRYMDMIGVDQKTNFFESRVTSYHRHEASARFDNDAMDF